MRAVSGKKEPDANCRRADLACRRASHAADPESHRGRRSRHDLRGGPDRRPHGRCGTETGPRDAGQARRHARLLHAHPQGLPDRDGTGSRQPRHAGLRRPRLHPRARHGADRARRTHRNAVRRHHGHPGARPARPQGPAGDAREMRARLQSHHAAFGEGPLARARVHRPHGALDGKARHRVEPAHAANHAARRQGPRPRRLGQRRLPDVFRLRDDGPFLGAAGKPRSPRRFCATAREPNRRSSTAPRFRPPSSTSTACCRVPMPTARAHWHRPRQSCRSTRITSPSSRSSRQGPSAYCRLWSRIARNSTPWYQFGQRCEFATPSPTS